jgi:tripartite-type tricarboxylate transporter receptor subunit TctC
LNEECDSRHRHDRRRDEHDHPPISRPATAIKEAVVLPEFRARIEATGAVVRSGSAEEWRRLLAGDVAKWAKLVKDNNIKFAP